MTKLTKYLGGYFQKTTQKHSEMVLSAAKGTFEISKLQNYMSHVNETCSRYVPCQHLSFAQKSGWQQMGGWGWGQIQIKCHEINKISTLTPTNNSLQNAMNFGIFLLLSLIISL